MALTKVNYVDGVTTIMAKNLNDIQDEVIANGTAITNQSTQISSKADAAALANETAAREAADAALSGDVDDLKSHITQIATITVSPNLYNPEDPDALTDKYLNPNGVLETYSGRTVTGFIPVTAGNKVVFSQNGSSYTYASSCFYGENKTTVVSGGDYNKSIVTVPSSASFVRITFATSLVNVQIECNSTGVLSSYEPFGTTANLILDDTFTSEEFPPSAKATLEKIDGEIGEQIKSTVVCKNLYNPDDPDVVQNTYINPNGAVETVSGRTVTGFMSVDAGEKVVLSRSNGATREEIKWASICFYNEAKSVVSGGQYNTNKLVVPTGAAFARVTFSSSLQNVQIECNATGNMTSYEAYFPTYTELNTDIKVQISSVNGIDGIKNVPDSFRWNGNITAGDIVKLPVNNVKNQQVFAFSGDISTIGKIKIGRMLANNTTYGAFEIDSTSVKFYCDNGSTYTIPHGLTIQNNIQIEFATENTFNLSKAVIISNGVRFDIFTNLTDKRFLGDEGAPFVQSDGSVLHDCSFTWTSRNIAKPIWMFGDSYMSLYDVRWVYYLIQDGYDKSCLINAYAGEASAAALMSLKNLLTLKSRPRYILWALGMNDPDTDSAVNASWKACYDAVIDLCERNSIVPVLATIPNTPTMNNVFKNAIIKASGYRYIDFASAVGATEAESGWYSGMLNSDNVHPNTPGAIALYYQALADFPELAST